MARRYDIARRRRLALQYAARLERDLQPGIRETARIWRTMRKALVRAPARRNTSLAEIIQPAMRKAAPILRDAMILAWSTGVEHAAASVKPLLPIRLAYKRELAKLFGKLRLTPTEIDTLQKQFGKRALDTLTMTGDALEKRLAPVVRKIIADGSTTREAIARMAAAVENTGLGPTKAYQLEAIYRTQSAIAAGVGRQEAMENPIIAEMVWGYEYVTVGDDRVRPEHAEQNGHRAAKDNPYWSVWLPPNGWNCRCTVIEIYKDEAPTTQQRVPPGEPDTGFAAPPMKLMSIAVDAGAIIGRMILG